MRWLTNTSGNSTPIWPSLNQRWRWFLTFYPSSSHHFVQDKGRLSQTESEEEEVVNKKKMKDKKKKGVKEEENNKKKKKAKKVRQIQIGRSHQCSQVENLTTPLISYVGSGVPQEVLDMPVDPNEPTYCTCQQVKPTRIKSQMVARLVFKLFSFSFQTKNTPTIARLLCDKLHCDNIKTD